MDRFRKNYGKKHMQVSDLPAKQTTLLVIVSAAWKAMQDFEGRDVEKIVLEFEGDWRPLIVPGPVANVLGPRWGTNIKSWVGRTLPLRPEKTDVRGKVVDCFRCDVDTFDDADDATTQVATRTERQPPHPGEALYAHGKGGGVADLESDEEWTKGGANESDDTDD